MASEAQADVYRELATRTDIDVHLYLPADASPDSLGGAPVTVHTDRADELGRYWFLLFEDGGEGRQDCVLVARETDDGTYQGVWTYDPDLVAAAFEALDYAS